jgi:hypothetical protein
MALSGVGTKYISNGIKKHMWKSRETIPLNGLHIISHKY